MGRILGRCLGSVNQLDFDCLSVFLICRIDKAATDGLICVQLVLVWQA